jgi:hypothetical protein
MDARHLIGKASYGPEELKILFQAFDAAWDVVAPGISGRATAVEAARLTLAEIVLSLAASGKRRDAKELTEAAIQAFRTLGR